MVGWRSFERTIPVQCETLERFCADRRIERIDFLPMDVQGAAALVVQGAGQMMRRVVALWLEVADREMYSGQELRESMGRMLRKKGFALGFEVLREGEGDQFYVNLRVPRVWWYLAMDRARR